ncbi:MAG: SCO family protein [Methylocella sp.]
MALALAAHDQAGRPRSDECGSCGASYLVFFGYTHCADFCPTALFDISAVFKELGPDKKVAAPFVTVEMLSAHDSSAGR